MSIFVTRYLKIRNASLITVVLATPNRFPCAMSVVRSSNHHLQVLVLLPRSRLVHRHVAGLGGCGAGRLRSKQVLNLQVKPEYVSIHHLMKKNVNDFKKKILIKSSTCFEKVPVTGVIPQDCCSRPLFDILSFLVAKSMISCGMESTFPGAPICDDTTAVRRERQTTSKQQFIFRMF